MPYISNLDWIRAGEYPDETVLNRPISQLLNNTEFLRNIIEGQLLPIVQDRTGIYMWDVGFPIPYPVYVVGSDQKLYALKPLGDQTQDPVVSPADWDGPFPFTDTYVIDSDSTTLGLLAIADGNQTKTNASGVTADPTYDPLAITARHLPNSHNRFLQLDNGANPSTNPNVFTTLKDAIDAIPQGTKGTITVQSSNGDIFINNQIIEVVNKEVILINTVANIARTDGKPGTILIRNGKLTMYCDGSITMAYRNSPPYKYRGMFTLDGNAILEFKPANYANYFISPFTRSPVVTNKVAAFGGAANNTNTPFLSVYGSNNSFACCNSSFVNYKTSGATLAQFADIEPTHGSLSISNTGKGPTLTSQFTGFALKSIPQNSAGALYQPSEIGYNSAYFTYATTLGYTPCVYAEAFPVRGGGGVAASGTLIDSVLTTKYYAPFNNRFGRINYLALEKFPGINVFDFSCGGVIQRTIDSTGWNEQITSAEEYSLDLSCTFLLKTPQVFSTDDNYVVSISKLYDGTANTNNLFSCWVDSSGVLHLQHDSGLNVPTAITTTVTFLVKNEYQVAIVRDTTAKTYEIYVDGVLADTQVYVTNPNKGATPEQLVHLLCDANLGTNTNQYNIMVGSLNIYAPALLSGPQLTNLFNAATIIN